MTIDSKALTRAAESMAEAVKHARLAYQFCPGSYTMTMLQSCLHQCRDRRRGNIVVVGGQKRSELARDR
jgi:hypothetical protein